MSESVMSNIYKYLRRTLVRSLSQGVSHFSLVGILTYRGKFLLRCSGLKTNGNPDLTKFRPRKGFLTHPTGSLPVMLKSNHMYRCVIMLCHGFLPYVNCYPSHESSFPFNTYSCLTSSMTPTAKGVDKIMARQYPPFGHSFQQWFPAICKLYQH